LYFFLNVKEIRIIRWFSLDFNLLTILSIFIFFYNALLYFQTVDIFLLIPLCIETIYIESTNKIRLLLDYLILCLLFKYYRSRYSPKWQDCVKEIRSITPNQSLSQRDKMKNGMYINRKRVTDWQRETYRATQYKIK
jgi:hypothetical protein